VTRNEYWLSRSRRAIWIRARSLGQDEMEILASRTLEIVACA